MNIMGVTLNNQIFFAPVATIVKPDSEKAVKV